MPTEITITGYTFAELSEDVKQKVLDKNRMFNTEDTEWYDFTLDDWKDKLTELGYYDVEIYFSGFYSQGDGACYTAKVDIPKWIKAHKMCKELRVLYSRITKYDDYCQCEITHAGHYYHENSVTANAWGEIYSSENANTINKFELQVSQLERAVQQEVRELSKKIYRELDKECEYLESDEAVAEALEANEYLFTENGKRI